VHARTARQTGTRAPGGAGWLGHRRGYQEPCSPTRRHADPAQRSQTAATGPSSPRFRNRHYELRGWLALEHLTPSVKVVGFASEQAAAAAYLGGSVTAAYVQAGPEAQLIAKGGHPMINAEQIAKLGIPGLNVVAVADSVVKNDPALVQKYVCAEVQATRLFTGPQAGKYLTQSAKVQGVPANLIVPATKNFPFIPLSQQLHWLGSAPNDTSSPIVRAYVQTGRFLVGQGRLPSAPSATVIAAHVDPSFVKKALAGGC
jgi:ABC-type taurine transport system substrate-binding protein